MHLFSAQEAEPVLSEPRVTQASTPTHPAPCLALQAFHCQASPCDLGKGRSTPNRQLLRALSTLDLTPSLGRDSEAKGGETAWCPCLGASGTLEATGGLPLHGPCFVGGSHPGRAAGLLRQGTVHTPGPGGGRGPVLQGEPQTGSTCARPSLRLVTMSAAGTLAGAEPRHPVKWLPLVS